MKFRIIGNMTGNSFRADKSACVFRILLMVIIFNVSGQKRFVMACVRAKLTAMIKELYLRGSMKKEVSVIG
ncbi:MAG TPA: hypothetical protein DIC64_00670 [Alphaproteobacteria bacterium]|nr:hypothetical protein [Alphaproteobacteria bacterium]